MKLTHVATAAAVVTIGCACAAPVAGAATCAYVKKTKTVTLDLSANESGTLEVSGTAIMGTGGTARSGACGRATVTNTDAIKVRAPAGTAETVSISLRGGAFGPGATAETDGSGEIEISADLGGWDPNWSFVRDALSVSGSASDDFLALGADGFALNRDGDLDLAVTRHPEVDPIQAGPDIRIVGDAGADEITAQGGAGAGAPYSGYYGLEVWGGPQSDFSWDDGPNRLTGGAGPDRLNGGIGVANVISGEGGDDGVFGSLRDDTLSGGPGADSVFGDDGTDALSGDAGDDSMHGGAGDDRVDGGDGGDSLNGDTGDDEVLGGAGDDFITADDGYADALDGGDGTDRGYVDSRDSWTSIEEVFRF
jgi:hemolysin type calcium-binding protein